MTHPTFSERLATRRRLWWDAPWWARGRAPGIGIHRLRERTVFRSRDDPDEAWRCCPFWQRTLLNKWNSREFAAKYGCQVPELYWRGGPLSSIPFGSLPDHLVVRPVWGAFRHGVLVVAAGAELLRHEAIDGAGLRRKLSRSRRVLRRTPILIEECVRAEDGTYRLPLEYKCHCFGETVAAVELVERTAATEAKHRCYTPDWEPFPDPLNLFLPEAPIRDPPDGLRDLVLLAAALGRGFETYARIDFFPTDRGWVFNEFSSVPWNGLEFTPYCDELFGALWAEKHPQAT